MKTIANSLMMMLLAVVCSAQDASQIVVTNLSDKLKTQVTYDKSTGLDIRRLNLDSIHADKHKSKHTTVQQIDVSVPQIRIAYVNNPLDSIKKFSSYIQNISLSLPHLQLTSMSIASKNVNNAFDVKELKTHQIQANVIVVDNSKFNVDVDESTFKELDDMQTIAEFEKNYSQKWCGQQRLRDIKRLSTELYAKWIYILKQNKKCSIELVKNRKRRKAIGEAWIIDERYDDNDRNNLLQNLRFFKDNGYGSVLVRFDCTEDINQLSQLVNDIIREGFEVFGAYTGKDNMKPQWSPFIEPDVLESFIQELSPKMTGFFLNWRVTSNHVKFLPVEYFNYMCNTLRKHNAKILIYGEVYMGVIGPLRTSTIVYTAPDNVTGVVVNNLGYYNSGIDYATYTLSYAVPKFGSMDKIGQVIGYGPYYCSRPDHNMQLTCEEEYMYKKKVEEYFKKIGYSTITMAHDGVDDNYTYVAGDFSTGHLHFNTTDNIVYDTKLHKTQQGNKQ